MHACVPGDDAHGILLGLEVLADGIGGGLWEQRGSAVPERWGQPFLVRALEFSPGGAVMFLKEAKRYRVL